jgi:hypothetical protein
VTQFAGLALIHALPRAPIKCPVNLIRIKRLIKRNKPYSLVQSLDGQALCLLDDDLIARYGVEDTDNVSAHDYDPNIVALIEEFKDGLLLDCGAGRRPVYYDKVVNCEISPH